MTIHKKIAVVCAAGIGDGLIVHMVSHHLQQLGSDVTTFSNHLASFGPWLAGYFFAPQPPLENIESIFADFDAIFLQHDNTEKAKKIKQLPLPVYTFYGSHNIYKHGPLDPTRDFICDPNQTMVENMKRAMERFFQSSGNENGLTPLDGLVHRKWTSRVAIHPTSASEEKNWPREKFLKLHERLKTMGYAPVFVVAPHERSDWEGPLSFTLSDLSSFIYESSFFIGNDSGTAHLASYLQIPNLVIGADPIHLRFWRPGWGPGALITPPSRLSRFKIIRKKWKSILSVNNVINSFKSMTLKL